jgi:hydrogenase maturation protease
VIELAKDEIPLYRNIKMSDHQITFQEVLGLAKFREKFPEHLHLVGAQPVDMSIGYGVSAEIEAVVPEILTRAEHVLRKWGLIE